VEVHYGEFHVEDTVAGHIPPIHGGSLLSPPPSFKSQAFLSTPRRMPVVICQMSEWGVGPVR
jgi:hypothetical protein